MKQKGLILATSLILKINIKTHERKVLKSKRGLILDSLVGKGIMGQFGI
jgi:hypothetical protein